MNDWIRAGIIAVCGAAVIAMAHFLFGVPIERRGTGRLMSDFQVMQAVGLLGLGGLILATIGLRVRKH
jgi:hypothetical protein